jgi:hypothetical protein
MSEAALCTVWGLPVPGREKHALDVYSEALQYWGRLQQEGKIERFDVVVFAPTGGDLTGLILARGTQAQLDSVRHSDEYERLLNRVQLVVQHVRAADAYVDEGLARIMSQYTDEVARVGV